MRALRLMRSLRGLILGLAVVALSANGLWASQSTTPAGLSAVESDFVKWALTQGGLTIVLLGTLWSYRRDMTRGLREEQARTQVLTALVEKSTEALVHLSDEIKHCPFHER